MWDYTYQKGYRSYSMSQAEAACQLKGSARSDVSMSTPATLSLHLELFQSPLVLFSLSLYKHTQMTLASSGKAEHHHKIKIHPPHINALGSTLSHLPHLSQEPLSTRWTEPFSLPQAFLWGLWNFNFTSLQCSYGQRRSMLSDWNEKSF